jgi:UPF0755 protein
MRSPSRFLALLVLLSSVILASVFSLIRQELGRVAIIGEDRSFSVSPGASLRSTLNELSTQQVLQHPRLIEGWARWQYGSQFVLKSGRYLFPAGSTGRDILEQLRLGKVQLDQITLIEGWNFEQFRHALDLHPGITHIWQTLSPAQVMEQLGSPGMHPEGRFFPDTYRFAAGTTDSTVYRLAFQRMQQELSRAWQERAPELSLRSPEELLTLASIIEKETGREDERGRVAGVFVNRLRIGMRLQSDPTVIYGLGSNYDGDIRRRDLLTDTPYNTYTREGLPPTPIAMPGAASLRAVARPEKTAAIYFVATGNGDGSHHFSATLAEHNAAVARLVHKQRSAQ